MEEFIQVFKALSDKTRLKIVRLLLQGRSDLCVCEIMDCLDESQYNVSRHLKVLKIARLVQEKREGRWVYYSLASPKNKFQQLILEAVLAVPEELLFLESERLKKRLSLRVNGKCVVGINSQEWHKILSQLTVEKGDQQYV